MSQINGNVLDRIVKHKRCEVEERKRLSPNSEDVPERQSDPRAFGSALRQNGNISVIAEFKKASPSKGIIRADAEPVEVAQIYEANGATSISVLTDESFFQGHADFLTAIRHDITLPVLRKDFIIDPYQIHESYAMGADAILLIVSILSKDELRTFQQIARDIGLECLVEVHHDEELLKALDADAQIIGINNRDLTDFSVDLNTSLDLKARIPEEIITVSESGIHGREDALALQSVGFDAILVGESLMRAADIGAKLRELVGIDAP